MNRINTYNELIIWQKSVELVTEVFKLTEQIPGEGSCGLAHELTKTAVSIPCNIAEGWGRENARGYAFFLKIAKGAGMELDTLVKIGYDLKLISPEQMHLLRLKIVELNSMLSTIIQKVKNKSLNNF